MGRQPPSREGQPSTLSYTISDRANAPCAPRQRGFGQKPVRQYRNGALVRNRGAIRVPKRHVLTNGFRALAPRFRAKSRNRPCFNGSPRAGATSASGAVLGVRTQRLPARGGNAPAVSGCRQSRPTAPRARGQRACHDQPHDADANGSPRAGATRKEAKSKLHMGRRLRARGGQRAGRGLSALTVLRRLRRRGGNALAAPVKVLLAATIPPREGARLQQVIPVIAKRAAHALGGRRRVNAARKVNAISNSPRARGAVRRRVAPRAVSRTPPPRAGAGRCI